MPTVRIAEIESKMFITTAGHVVRRFLILQSQKTILRWPPIVRASSLRSLSYVNDLLNGEQELDRDSVSYTQLSRE